MFLAFFTWLLIILSRHSTATRPDEPLGKNSQRDKCAVEGPYRRLTPSSKFFLYTPPNVGFEVGNYEIFNEEDSRRICGQHPALEQAEITHAYDLMTFRNDCPFQVWLGLNHKEEPGVFVHGNGRYIQFQTFFGYQPDNRGNVERCVVLAHVNRFGEMQDVGCSSNIAAVLCQFKTGSSCYMQSAEETANLVNPGKAELEPLLVREYWDPKAEGYNTNRYFASKFQKNWLDAKEVCLRYGMDLVKFYDYRLYEALITAVKSHEIQNDLSPDTQFWTSGFFTGSKENMQLNWLVGENIAAPVTFNVKHQWAAASPDTKEPIDQSGSGKEMCLDVSFEDREVVDFYRPLWRASNCLIPKYFFCERNIPAVSVEFIKNVTGVAAASGEGGTDSISENSNETSTMHCKAVSQQKRAPVQFELNINKHFTQEDIVKFMIFNAENGLRLANIPVEVKDEIKWKETVIELLVQIAKKSVPTEYVDHGVLNVVKVINLLYQNAVADENDAEREQIWGSKYIPHLQKCLETFQPLALVGTGAEITGYSNENDQQTITVYKELADNIKSLDSSIDFLWFLHSLSMATCYSQTTNKLTFASDYHLAFVGDFINKVKFKWIMNIDVKSGGAIGPDYAIAYGDVDIYLSMRNLRHVVTGTYVNNEIEYLQLVRPLSIPSSFTGTSEPLENTKTSVIMF